MSSRITNQVNKNVQSYTYKVKLALLTSVLLCFSSGCSCVVCLCHTNKLQYRHSSLTHVPLPKCAYHVNVMNKQFLRFYDSMIIDTYLCKVG